MVLSNHNWPKSAILFSFVAISILPEWNLNTKGPWCLQPPWTHHSVGMRQILRESSQTFSGLRKEPPPPCIKDNFERRELKSSSFSELPLSSNRSSFWKHSDYVLQWLGTRLWLLDSRKFAFPIEGPFWLACYKQADTFGRQFRNDFSILLNEIGILATCYFMCFYVFELPCN